MDGWMDGWIGKKSVDSKFIYLIYGKLQNNYDDKKRRKILYYK